MYCALNFTIQWKIISMNKLSIKVAEFNLHYSRKKLTIVEVFFFFTQMDETDFFSKTRKTMSKLVCCTQQSKQVHTHTLIFIDNHYIV